MAKKQTRRSISVSRSTYERLKAFCETNNISMSQFVETRVGDYLGSPGDNVATVVAHLAPASKPLPPRDVPKPAVMAPTPAAPRVAEAPKPASQPMPMTSAAARFAIEPPPPIIKPKADQAAPKPAEKRPDQIFTF